MGKIKHPLNKIDPAIISLHPPNPAIDPCTTLGP